MRVRVSPPALLGECMKKIQTIGDLMDELKKYPRKTPVRMMVFVDRRSDDPSCYDTDLSGDEEFGIIVTDLDSRVVLEKDGK